MRMDYHIYKLMEVRVTGQPVEVDRVCPTCGRPREAEQAANINAKEEAIQATPTPGPDEQLLQFLETLRSSYDAIATSEEVEVGQIQEALACVRGKCLHF